MSMPCVQKKNPQTRPKKTPSHPLNHLTKRKQTTTQDLHGKELEPEPEEEGGGRRRRKGGKEERDIVSIAEQLAKEEANWKKGACVGVGGSKREGIVWGFCVV